MHPLHNFLEPIRHIISIKFQSVYPLLNNAKLTLFCTGIRQTQQGVYNHVELFFACCDVVHPLQNFLEPIRHIISIKFQSFYPLLYYTKLKLFCTGLRQTQQGVYNHVELVFAFGDVVHPLHNFLKPIRHIISIKFQSVYPLLYYAKLKLFCTGIRQTQQGVYNHVELFFAWCDVVHPLHNFLEPIRHIISIKFQSVYPLLNYAKLTIFFTGIRQTQQGVYNHVELFFVFCDVVHPFHNFLEPIRHIISIKFQSDYQPLYNAKLKLFCTGIRQTQQGVYNHVELFFTCCDVVHPLHKFLESIMCIISLKFQCLATFVLHKIHTFLHRFTAYITRCLQACRVVFCLL